MLKSIRKFFDQNLLPPNADLEPESVVAPAHDPIYVAACALLLELAHADEEFTEGERAHIAEAMTRHFDLSPEVVAQVIALADEERKRSVDLYQFTSLIADRYDTGQKTVLAEVMWRVVYADGELAKHESYLMRKLSHLLGLRPGYLAEAHKRATEGGG